MRWRVAVLPLPELQGRIRDAVVAGQDAALAGLLVGGRDPSGRLAIHRRHYAASLAAALTRRFPALRWMLGEAVVAEAARRFAALRPPAAPCIAEYGADFPRFLADRLGATAPPWTAPLGSLDWALGEVALAVTRPPLAIAALQPIAPEALPDLRLGLQPGLRHAASGWALDEAIARFLAEGEPQPIAAEPVRLEIRGARGRFGWRRLDAGPFAFRRALSQGRALGEAAEAALGADAGFDPGAALAALFAEGLVTSVQTAGGPA